MSDAPSQLQPNPVGGRPRPQSNPLAAIRIVPYSPPRPLSTTSEPTHLSTSSAPPGITSPTEASPHHGDSRYTPGTRAISAATSSSTTAAAKKQVESNFHAHRAPRHANDSNPRLRSASPASAGSHMSLGTAEGRHVSARSVSGSRHPSDPGTPVFDATPSASPAPTDISESNGPAHAPVGRGDDKVAAPPKRPLSRRRNFVTVNSGKGTFALQPHPAAQSAFKSSSYSGHSLSTRSSLERLSDLFSSEGRPSTPLTALLERSQTSASSCTSTSSATHLAGDHTDPSTTPPWNYRLVGGLRKVSQTPDPTQSPANHPCPTQPSVETASDTQASPLPDSPPWASQTQQDLPLLLNKASFQSSQSASTRTERTNYKLYHASSSRRVPPVLNSDADSDSDGLLQLSSSSDTNANFQVIGCSSPPAPSSVDVTDPDSNSNYQILGRSSPPAPASIDVVDSDSNSNYQVLGRSSPPVPPSVDYSPSEISNGDANYVLHGNPSPIPSSASAARQVLRSEYSQESLVVPPLRPVKKKSSYERTGPYKSSSRESFRRASLSSINSIIGQEAIQAFLSTPIVLNRPGGPPGFSGIPPDPWTAGPSNLLPVKSQMQAHTHQWSSQLSTVFSESEGGSEGLSRSISPISAPGQRSSGWLSNHSRQMLSVSSMSVGEGAPNSQPQSTSSPLDRPQPVFHRGNTVRMVRDQDEHGDGLADLHDSHELHQRPSRRRLASYLSSSSLHSSASSSRSNSFNNSSLPVWARLYYGSGERRWLRHAPSFESIMTDYSEGRPPSSLPSGSPSPEHLPLNIQNSRRRPREMPVPEGRSTSETGSMVISPAPVQGFPFRPGLRKQTSSVWSPHLRRDQRASGYSVWDPPSVSWSAETGLLGRRNIQVALFIIGFILPFAWMIAAFLPLPSCPRPDMSELTRTSLLNVEMELRRVAAVDELQYWSARWWRNLNRIMAVVGLLVVGAIVALVVIGVKQGW